MYFNTHRARILIFRASNKAIRSDMDAYQEEMISLKHNIHRNNYPESLTLVPRNLERTIENNTRKLIMSVLCQKPSRKDPKDISSICHQDNIHKWLKSTEVSLPCQATNRFQHDQELRVLHPL